MMKLPECYPVIHSEWWDKYKGYSQFIDLINQEMRTPSQQPDISMAADPRLDLTPFLYRTLESLQRKQLMQADTVMPTNRHPNISDPTEQLRGSVQTAAQQPAVATTPQWVAPQQAAVAPAPQVQAQMGTTQVPYSPTQSSPR